MPTERLAKLVQEIEHCASHAAQRIAHPAITWLIDNADAYRALLAACRDARESIWISQLAFDADCMAYVPDDESLRPGEAREMRLADTLVAACTERGVQVRVLLNASILLDTAKPLRAYFRRAGVPRELLHVRGMRRFPQLLHAKLVVVDGTVAFLIGSPFANGYWDESHHPPRDARRGNRELGGRPLHDVSVRFAGAGVGDLCEQFVESWNAADDVERGDDERLESPTRGDDTVEAHVSIVATMPAPRSARHPAGRTQILERLLDGIAGARRLIYIEHQYLSARPVAAALMAALDREPALEIIVTLNQNPDVTAYRGWQNALLAESGLGAHPRVGLFCLWSVGDAGAGGRRSITQLFVHSKVVIVDDRWAMVGSANLDGVSLHSYGDDFSSWLGRRVFRGVRNVDLSAVVTAPGAVLELRTALWREHLDQPDLDSAVAPPRGWLSLWSRATRDAIQLLSEPASSQDSRILVLPYSRMSTPERQLRDAGVDVASCGLELCFDPSWVEVHLSPNWVRNMFA